MISQGTHPAGLRYLSRSTIAAQAAMTGGSTSGQQRQAAPQSAKDVKVAFVGAGGINFGTPEGPWNHSARLQLLPGVTFSAICDPNLELAQKRIDTLSAGEHGDKWKGCKTFPSYQAMLDAPGGPPDAVFIGLPPKFHGSLDDPNADIEVQLARAGVHQFVEKPLSVRPAEEVGRLSQELQRIQKDNGVVIAVGYMFRYAPLVEAAKRVLKETGAKPLGVVGRYACAYTFIEKRDWWDTALSGGPIVEQATHFVDLMRHFCGEIVESSIKAVAVGPSVPLSDMPKPPLAEHEVPMERRINRVTAAVFEFESGAVGSLTHSALMHKSHYATELEILADGLHLVLQDPYGSPKLLVRRPHSEEYVEENINHDEDMYLREVEAFIDAVRIGDTSAIKSLYADAALSYQATQWITAASNSGHMGPAAPEP
ncbi:hypothetical protein WJX72_003082 [[Myrmecia] bisecta]|uniref:Oxidoreductase n=1 Tax=[Myrmecia] bisecta TaxID=41462 RepID=A0AAW1PGI2_9CHLO